MRARPRPVAQVLGDNYVLEDTGQTTRFFSDRYLRELLANWQDVHLEPVEITHPVTGDPFKPVWRGVGLR